MANGDAYGMDNDDLLTFEFLLPPKIVGDVSVVRFEGKEALSRLYSFDVVLASSDLTEHLEYDLLGAQVFFIMGKKGEAPRTVAGIVGLFAFDDAVPLGNNICLRVHLVPRLWLATQRVRCRIFQERTTADIVNEVLGEWKVQYRWDAMPRSKPRAYCTQYQESDYEFLSRLLAEEGLFFYFEQPKEKPNVGKPGKVPQSYLSSRPPPDPSEILVVCDDARCYRPLAKSNEQERKDRRPQAERTLPQLFLRRGANSFGSDESSLFRFELNRSLLPKSVALSSYDFRRHGSGLLAEASVDDKLPAPYESQLQPAPKLQILASPLFYKQLAVHQHCPLSGSETNANAATPENDVARRVLEETRQSAYVGAGTSRHWRFEPGRLFNLLGHPVGRANVNYVITEVEHVGRVTMAGDKAEGDIYHNKFKCLPADVPWRPQRPKRRSGVLPETATVVGAGEEEIHTDRYGRVKVRFAWDVEDGGSPNGTCWIRVAQPWAGSHYGCHFIPRVGNEVVVTFLRGDPDNPLITGSVHNASQMPPFDLPADKSRSGIRTESSPNLPTGQGYNELSFEDMWGHEQIRLRAQRDLRADVVRDREVSIGANDSLSVGGALTETITLARIETVEGRKSSSVVLDSTESVGGNSTRVVRGASDELVEKDQKVTVNGDGELNVGGSSRTRIGTDGRSCEAITSILGKETTEVTDCMRMVSHERIVLECGTSRVVIGPDEVRIVAERLSMAATKVVNLTADGPVLEMTREVAITGDALKLSSPNAAVRITRDVEITGQKVNMNG